MAKTDKPLPKGAYVAQGLKYDPDKGTIKRVLEKHPLKQKLKKRAKKDIKCS